MTKLPTRREFLAQSSYLAAGLGLTAASGPLLLAANEQKGRKRPLFRISLAEYSLHRTIRSGKLDTLDLGRHSVNEFQIKGLDRWNRTFMDKVKNTDYLTEMKKRDSQAGAQNLLIMIDGEGNLGDPDEKRRQQAVKNHFKWVEAAKRIGCSSIRVNAGSAGGYQEQLKLAADGLRRLCQFAAKMEMNVIVENHGGLSSNGAWLAAVMKKVALPNCGTLPDFGNFGSYDRYKGVEETMPFAKSVSAKSHDFDADGNETKTDYLRMMKIVIDSGYRGWVGIEYEGGKLSEHDGILATKKLLERVREKLTA